MSIEADEAQSAATETTSAALELTECELLMAEHVISGRSIKDIAMRRGVCVDTARAQVRTTLVPLQLRQPGINTR